MRRSPVVLLSLVLLGIAAQALTAAGPGAAKGGQTRHRSPSSLTISAAPPRATAGAPVTIAGRLRSRRAQGAVILLWRRLPGWRRFLETAATIAGRGGRYKFTLAAGHVNTNRWFRTSTRGKRSHEFYERVHAVVTLTASQTSVARAIGSRSRVRSHRGTPGSRYSSSSVLAPAGGRSHNQGWIPTRDSQRAPASRTRAWSSCARSCPAIGATSTHTRRRWRSRSTRFIGSSTWS